MSDSNDKPVPPIVPEVAFVGYKGGELVYNIVEARPSKDTANILLDNKGWPNLRKIPTPADGFQMPVMIAEGELYAGKTRKQALEGLKAFYLKKLSRYTTASERVQSLIEAEERGDPAPFKDYRMV
jgi:hypothetical protein